MLDGDAVDKDAIATLESSLEVFNVTKMMPLKFCVEGDEGVTLGEDNCGASKSIEGGKKFTVPFKLRFPLIPGLCTKSIFVSNLITKEKMCVSARALVEDGTLGFECTSAACKDAATDATAMSTYSFPLCYVTPHVEGGELKDAVTDIVDVVSESAIIFKVSNYSSRRRRIIPMFGSPSVPLVAHWQRSAQTPVSAMPEPEVLQIDSTDKCEFQRCGKEVVLYPREVAHVRFQISDAIVATGGTARIKKGKLKRYLGTCGLVDADASKSQFEANIMRAIQFKVDLCMSVFHLKTTAASIGDVGIINGWAPVPFTMDIVNDANAPLRVVLDEYPSGIHGDTSEWCVPPLGTICVSMVVHFEPHQRDALVKEAGEDISQLHKIVKSLHFKNANNARNIHTFSLSMSVVPNLIAVRSPNTISESSDDTSVKLSSSLTIPPPLSQNSLNVKPKAVFVVHNVCGKRLSCELACKSQPEFADAISVALVSRALNTTLSPKSKLSAGKKLDVAVVVQGLQGARVAKLPPGPVHVATVFIRSEIWTRRTDDVDIEIDGTESTQNVLVYANVVAGKLFALSTSELVVYTERRLRAAPQLRAASALRRSMRQSADDGVDDEGDEADDGDDDETEAETDESLGKRRVASHFPADNFGVDASLAGSFPGLGALPVTLRSRKDIPLELTAINLSAVHSVSFKI